jgi:predicted protein tyrosine phosphatase
MKKVTFLSRKQAVALTPPPGSVIISVHDRSESPAPLQDGWAARLTLEFHDTDGLSLGLTAFDSGMAAQVWAFAQEHEGSPDLFVHCEMGVSRSAAIALAVALRYNVPCYREATEVTPASHPWLNKQVFRLLQDQVAP